jgi:hypothetical protein
MTETDELELLTKLRRLTVENKDCRFCAVSGRTYLDIMEAAGIDPGRNARIDGVRFLVRDVPHGEMVFTKEQP